MKKFIAISVAALVAACLLNHSTIPIASEFNAGFRSAFMPDVDRQQETTSSQFVREIRFDMNTIRRDAMYIIDSFRDVK